MSTQEFAGEGLRTLALAYRELDEDVFGEWMERLQYASTVVGNREELLNELYEEVEQDLMVSRTHLATQCPHCSLSTAHYSLSTTHCQ